MSHWLTKYDEDNGEPYGEVCDCEIGDDHNGAGELNGLLAASEPCQVSVDGWCTTHSTAQGPAYCRTEGERTTNALIHYITGGDFL